MLWEKTKFYIVYDVILLFCVLCMCLCAPCVCVCPSLWVQYYESDSCAIDGAFKGRLDDRHCLAVTQSMQTLGVDLQYLLSDL